MKLLVIAAVQYFEKEIQQLLNQSEISIYSHMDISGHKKRGDKNLSDNWFAGGNGDQESVLFFAFAEKKAVEKVMEQVNEFNAHLDTDSPVRAFQLQVEKHN